MFRNSEFSSGFWLAVFAALGFSAKAIFVKLAYPYGVGPLALLTLRMAFSAPVFLVIAIRCSRNTVTLSIRDWLSLIVLGILGYYGSSLLDFIGLQHISAGLERLILFSYPTLTVLIATLVLGRPLKNSDLLALALAWTGIALAFAHDIKLGGGSAVWIGGSFVFASAVCYAIYLTGCGEMLARIGSRRFTALALCVSTAASFLHFATTHPLAELSQPAPVMLLAAAMAVFSTILPVFMLSAAIRSIGASRAALIGSIGPVITIGLSVIFLGETISFAQIAGTVLVLAGVMLTGRQARRPAAPAKAG